MLVQQTNISLHAKPAPGRTQPPCPHHRLCNYTVIHLVYHNFSRTVFTPGAINDQHYNHSHHDSRNNIGHENKISRRKALSIHRDIWYSARKCRQNIENIHDREEFAQLVKELLEGIAPFEGMKKLNPCPDSTIDLSGYLRNQKIGVMCINTAAKDNRVTADQIKGFLQEIKQAQFNIGIIITSGSYTDEARRFVRRMSGRIKIHLVESNGLLHMAKRTEHPIFPVEKWQEEGYTRISGLEMALSIKENIMASKKEPFYSLCSE